MIKPIRNLAQLFSEDDQLLRIPAGHELYHQGSSGACGYVVKYGEVDIRVNGKLLETGSVGCLLGEECLLNTIPRRTTVIAASDCGLVAVDRNRMGYLVQRTPGLLNHIKRIIELRQDELELADRKTSH